MSNETALRFSFYVAKSLVGGLFGVWLLNFLRDRVIYPKRYGRPPDEYCTVISSVTALLLGIAAWVYWVGWSR